MVIVTTGKLTRQQLFGEQTDGTITAILVDSAGKLIVTS